MNAIKDYYYKTLDPRPKSANLTVWFNQLSMVYGTRNQIYLH